MNLRTILTVVTLHLLLLSVIAHSQPSLRKSRKVDSNKWRSVNKMLPDKGDKTHDPNSCSSITNVLNNIASRLEKLESENNDLSRKFKYRDCFDLKIEDPTLRSGIFEVFPAQSIVRVWCDMETMGGGWTVFQNRLPLDSDHEHPSLDFARNMRDYEVGFGDPDEDHWAGLINLRQWTHNRHYEMRVHLTDFKDKKAHAHYRRFYIDDADHGYRLHLEGFSGDAGDALGADEGDNFTANGMLFSTHDRDMDTSHEINCAAFWQIGGWWFNRCSWANLNGPYKQKKEEGGIGINWHKWRNKEVLKATTMMIRPARNV